MLGDYLWRPAAGQQACPRASANGLRLPWISTIRWCRRRCSSVTGSASCHASRMLRCPSSGPLRLPSSIRARSGTPPCRQSGRPCRTARNCPHRAGKRNRDVQTRSHRSPGCPVRGADHIGRAKVMDVGVRVAPGPGSHATSARHAAARCSRRASRRIAVEVEEDAI
jgi:hypothetical protein